MSDGASEGYRWARESEARQKKVDGFFETLARVVSEQGAVGELKPAFETFDAIRYEGHIARGRLEKSKGKRWSAFRQTLMKAVETEDRKAWAEILALALQFASRDATGRVQAIAAPFADVPIALYASNGPGRAPSIFGAFEAVLDGGADGREVDVIRIEDPERAIVGIIIGGGESTEPERGVLRFMAAL